MIEKRYDTAVSYTHLDVYKRQMLTMVDRDAFLFNPFLSGNVNVCKLTPASDGVRTQPVGSCLLYTSRGTERGCRGD